MPSVKPPPPTVSLPGPLGKKVSDLPTIEEEASQRVVTRKFFFCPTRCAKRPLDQRPSIATTTNANVHPQQKFPPGCLVQLGESKLTTLNRARVRIVSYENGKVMVRHDGLGTMWCIDRSSLDKASAVIAVPSYSPPPGRPGQQLAYEMPAKRLCGPNRVVLPPQPTTAPSLFWKLLTKDMKILLVGEGNFSFALELARRIGTGSGMMCTDARLNANVRRTSNEFLIPLLETGASVNTNVDATKLADHFGEAGFDAAIWNFPHTATPNRSTSSIPEHQALLRSFVKQCEIILKPGGKGVITLKNGYPYTEWKADSFSTPMMTYLGGEAFTPALFPNYKHVTTVDGAATLLSVFPATSFVYRKQGRG